MSNNNSQTWLPKSFQCGCRTVRVEYLQEFPRGVDDARGLCDSECGLISIRTHLSGKELPEDALIESLGHEMTHFILETMDRQDLSRDENFVSVMSNLAVQALISICLEVSKKSAD